MQTFAIVVSVVIAVVAIALFVRAIAYIVAVVKTGQPTAGRSDNPGRRWVTMLKETLGHTRMLQWSHVGILHWFIFVGFGFLFFTLVNAFGQLFDAEFALPVIGHWVVYQWATELITWLMLLAILGLITIRLVNRPRGASGRYSRFSGSRMWQGYFVEAVIVGIALCIITLRGAEYALQGDAASRAHFPLTFFVGEALSGLSASALATLIYLVAMVKIVISFTWMIVISLNTTMGVAWHRFTAWPNIWFKRHADGRPSLGAMQPMLAGGVPIDFEDIEELDEDTAFGVGKVEDFSWKDILDFTSCTECGRCQSQCPAWNTEKPLSPKLFVMNLRDHAHAKAPYLRADESERGSLPGDRRTGGGAAVDRRRRRLRSHRPRRALVVYVVWRVCAAVPCRHRARRPHHGHAAVPGACRVELPDRAQPAVPGPGEQGQPVEHVAERADGLGQGPAVRGQAGRRRRGEPRRGRLAVLGRLRRRL